MRQNERLIYKRSLYGKIWDRIWIFEGKFMELFGYEYNIATRVGEKNGWVKIKKESK